MITKSVVSELESIVNNGLESSPIPYTKGNSIRIKNMVVRHNSRKGYLIYDTKSNSQIARTNFKSSALAIAKNLTQGNDVTSTLLFYDKELLKHYNDVIFFKNIIKKTKDAFSAEIRETRLEISMEKTRDIKEKIDNFIF